MNRNNIGTIPQIFANNHCEQMNVCSGCGIFKLENPSRVIPTKRKDSLLVLTNYPFFLFNAVYKKQNIYFY